MPSGVNRNGGLSSIRLQDLQGTEIAQGTEKVAETVSSRIELSTDFGGGLHLPDIKISARTVDDPQAKDQIIDVAGDRLAGISSSEDFKALLGELQTAHKDFLVPDRSKLTEALGGDDSHFAFNNISGRRIEQFYTEATALLSKTELSGDDLKAARKEINLAHADAYRGRSINFDKADTSTYWSYGKDKAYVHVYEKMLASLPEDSPQRESIQNHVDFIFSKKYVYSGGVKENDAEKTIGLVAIDKDSRNVVSVRKSSLHSPNPTFETIKVGADGGDHAGKQVAWNNSTDKYTFQGTSEEVPAELLDKLERTPVRNVTFRRAEDGEQLRDGFKFDWNGNRMLDAEKIDTGWWGHCDTQALLETIHADMADTKGVTEFRADSGTTTNYTRKDLMEIMASQMNMGGGYNIYGTNQSASLGETQFGGSRYNEQPDTMYLNVGGQWQNFNVNIEKMSKPGAPDEAENVGNIFKTHIMGEDGRSFEANEDLMQTISGDTNIVDGNKRVIEGKAEYYTVNANGQWVETENAIKIDPNSDEPVLLGTQINSIGSRSLTRTYFNPKTGELSRASVSFQKNDEGKYEAKEGNKSTIGYSRSTLLAREMQDGDDVEGKTRLTDGAIRTGNSIATDSSKGMEVWNGAVYKLREEVTWRSDDGRFEKITIHSDSRYGSGKVGSKINELDDEGNVIDTNETNAPVDFFWRDIPRVAPIVNENGKWYINNGMTERGMLDLNNLDASLDTFRNLNDLLYLGLNSKDNKEVYTIVHDGKRLVYDTKEAWEADVQKIQEAAGRIEPEPTPQPE